MTVEKKMIRSDIPGHNTLLTGTMPYGGHAAPSAAEEHRRLTVGRDIVLSGDIAHCDHLVVEGTVEAKTLSTQRLDILETGAFTGKADVKDAVIAGRFDGSLTVTGRLTIKAAAVVKGEIEYGALEMEAGSRCDARISARPAPAEAQAAQPQAAKPAKEAEKADKLFGGANDAAAQDVETTEERPGTFRRAVGY